MGHSSSKVVQLNPPSATVLAQYRLHPERLELGRTQERWLGLCDGALPEAHFSEGLSLAQTLARLRSEFPKVDAACREMDRAGGAAKVALYLSMEWMRFRMSGQVLVQTTDEAELILRHSELDASVPIWTLVSGPYTVYYAFGESWASRPVLNALAAAEARVEGVYVTGRTSRAGDREIDLTIVGRRKVGRSGYQDFADIRTVTVEDARAPLTVVLAKQLARRVAGIPTTLDTSSALAVCQHLAKAILLDAVIEEHDASWRRVAATHPLAARLASDQKPIAAVFPKLVVGPLSLDEFVPADVMNMPEGTVWDWRPGQLRATPENNQMRVSWSPPGLQTSIVPDALSS